MIKELEKGVDGLTSAMRRRSAIETDKYYVDTYNKLLIYVNENNADAVEKLISEAKVYSDDKVLDAGYQDITNAKLGFSALLEIALYGTAYSKEESVNKKTAPLLGTYVQEMLRLSKFLREGAEGKSLIPGEHNEQDEPVAISVDYVRGILDDTMSHANKWSAKNDDLKHIVPECVKEIDDFFGKEMA